MRLERSKEGIWMASVLLNDLSSQSCSSQAMSTGIFMAVTDAGRQWRALLSFITCTTMNSLELLWKHDLHFHPCVHYWQRHGPCSEIISHCIREQARVERADPIKRWRAAENEYDMQRQFPFGQMGDLVFLTNVRRSRSPISALW